MVSANSFTNCGRFGENYSLFFQFCNFAINLSIFYGIFTIRKIYFLVATWRRISHFLFLSKCMNKDTNKERNFVYLVHRTWDGVVTPVWSSCYYYLPNQIKKLVAGFIRPKHKSLRLFSRVTPPNSIALILLVT